MNSPARPTLSVLRALTRGWINPQHHAAVRDEHIQSVFPLAKLGHPLIAQAAADTAAAPGAPSTNQIIRCVRAATGRSWLEIKNRNGMARRRRL